MFEFRYLAAIPNKNNQKETISSPPLFLNQVKRAQEKHEFESFKNSQFRKSVRGIRSDSYQERLSTMINSPNFRKKSPGNSLGQSLNISNLLNTLNSLDFDSNTAKNELRASTALNRQYNTINDFVNPHAPFKDSFLIIKKTDLHGFRKSKPKTEFIKTPESSKQRKKIHQKLERLDIKQIKDKQ